MRKYLFIITALSLILSSYSSQLMALPGERASSGTTELHLIAPPGNKTISRALPLLANYLMLKVDGIGHVHPFIPRSYHYAGEKFESGQVDAFFGGSFLSYILCARDLAVPLARGERHDGVSTYHSVLLARRTTDYSNIESIKGKRVTYVTEASSGEFYARKLFGGRSPDGLTGINYVPTKTHELAVRFLHVNRADFAFVKNLVWEEIKDQYPDLHVVDQDNGENPNDIFLVSKTLYASHGEEIKKRLLELHNDSDPMAQHLLKLLNIKRFIVTDYPESFDHTSQLVKDAGIDAKSYQFNK